MDRNGVSCAWGCFCCAKICWNVCNTNDFPSLQFGVPHKKPHGARGLSKHYHIRFDTKQLNFICVICFIPCACSEYTYRLDKPWVHDFSPQQQLRYQPVTDWTYWPVLRSFKNLNIITLSHKATTNESFEGIHHVLLDGISYYMASLVQYGKYGSLNTTDTTTMVYYVIKNFLIRKHFKRWYYMWRKK